MWQCTMCAALARVLPVAQREDGIAERLEVVAPLVAEVLDEGRRVVGRLALAVRRQQEDHGRLVLVGQPVRAVLLEVERPRVVPARARLAHRLVGVPAGAETIM